MNEAEWEKINDALLQINGRITSLELLLQDALVNAYAGSPEALEDFIARTSQQAQRMRLPAQSEPESQRDVEELTIHTLANLSRLTGAIRQAIHRNSA